MDRADYWQIRALNEQLAKETAIADQTRSKLRKVAERVKADGGPDLMDGSRWDADDEHETFVRTDTPKAE